MDARLKTYPIVIDRPRKLTINLNTLADAEELTGMKVFEGDGLFANRSAANLRALLYAFLKPDDPDLTLEGVGELIGIGNVRPIYREVLKAFADATGSSEASADAPEDDGDAAEEDDEDPTEAGPSDA